MVSEKDDAKKKMKFCCSFLADNARARGAKKR
jgi:hypothetical protein